MSNTGQTFLTLAALMALSALTFNANRMILYSFQDQLLTKRYVAAMVQGTSLLEEIQTKAFDQVVAGKDPNGKAVGYKANKISDLTDPTQLRPETGEKYPYNDVDDYNGYKRKAWVPLFSDSLSLSATVTYVTTSNPSQVSSVRTALKKVTVTVLATEKMAEKSKPDTLVLLKFGQVVYL
jgi:hypothetical protein